MAGDRIINILWTGGLDSTYRIVELSQYAVIVQPYYLIDPLRQSTKYEIRAMSRIRELLLQNKKTLFKLLQTKYIDIREIPADEEITQSYIKLYEKYKLGSQYDWLARFAKYADLQLEFALEKSPRGKAFRTISNESKIVTEQVGELSVYKIDEAFSSKEVCDVLGNFRFPCTLWTKTKEQEVDEMRRLRMDDVLSCTWFCHKPIFGLTCGHCHPCQDALHEGMAWRISMIGFILGWLRNIFIKAKNVIKKLSRL